MKALYVYNIVKSNTFHYITFLINKHMTVKEFRKLKNIFRPLKLYVGSRIPLMLMAATIESSIKLLRFRA